MFTLPLNEQSHLKILEKRHALELYQLTDSCREYLREWLPWVDGTKSVSDTERFIEGGLQQFANNNGFQAGIWHQNKLVGCIGFHGIHWLNRSISLGYWLGKGDQGKGLMSSACRALVDYAFQEYQLNRIEIRCGVDNKKSRAIPERPGFKLEGTICQAERMADARFIDHAIYGLLARDWKSGRGDRPESRI